MADATMEDATRMEGEEHQDSEDERLLSDDEGPRGTYVPMHPFVRRKLRILSLSLPCPSSVQQLRLLDQEKRALKRRYHNYLSLNSDLLLAGAGEGESSDEDGELPSSASPQTLRATYKAMLYKLRLRRSELKNIRVLSDIATSRINQLEEERELINARMDDLEAEDTSKDDMIKQLELERDALEGRLTTCREELAACNAELVELRAQKEALAGKTLATALHKPPIFDGKNLLGNNKSGQQVDDWIRTVQRYTKAIKLNDADTVSMAASLLREEASRAWLAREALLQGQNKEVTLEEIRDCLFKRFTPAATVATARSMLDKLRQDKQYRSIAAYVAEFDRICSLIPDLGAADKIHRFISGLHRSVAMKISIDPITNQRYTDYERMRTAALHSAAHDADYVDQLADLVDKRPNFKKHKGNRHGGGGSSSSSGRNPAGGGNGGGAAAAAGGGGAAAGGGNGGNPNHSERTPLVRKFCKERGLCMRCYQKGHLSKECTAEAASGFPPGFVGSAGK